MPRNNRGTRRRVFDTRLNFKQICKLLKISPLQRVKLIKYLRNEVDLKDSENT